MTIPALRGLGLSSKIRRRWRYKKSLDHQQCTIEEVIDALTLEPSYVGLSLALAVGILKTPWASIEFMITPFESEPTLLSCRVKMVSIDESKA